MYSCGKRDMREFTGCDGRSYSEEELKEKVWSEIQRRQVEVRERLKDAPPVETEETEKRIKELEDERFSRYTAYADGKLERVAFVERNRELNAEICDLQDELTRKKAFRADYDRMVKTLTPFTEMTELTREGLLDTVEAVHVETSEVRIKLKGEEWLRPKLRVVSGETGCCQSLEKQVE